MNGAKRSKGPPRNARRLLVVLDPAPVVHVLTAPDALEAEQLRELAERLQRWLLREQRGIRAAA